MADINISTEVQTRGTVGNEGFRSAPVSINVLNKLSSKELVLFVEDV